MEIKKTIEKNKPLVVTRQVNEYQKLKTKIEDKEKRIKVINSNKKNL